MTDLGTTVDAGSALAGGEPAFHAFTEFIRRFTSLLRQVVIDLAGVRGLDEELRRALTSLLQEGALDRYAAEITRAVDELDTAARVTLVLHGLADDSPDMRSMAARPARATVAVRLR